MSSCQSPCLEFELERYRLANKRDTGFNKEAKAAFLKFAEAPDTRWSGNFRDLNAAVTRMATLAPRGRIRVEEVAEEIQRLRENWHRPGAPSATETVDLDQVLTPEVLAELDPFHRVQLSYVAAVCRRSKSLSDAGREIFAISRSKRSVTNDADRLKKYLAKFDLKFESLRRG